MTIPQEITDQKIAWRQKYISDFNICLNDPNKMLAAINEREGIRDKHGNLLKNLNQQTMSLALQSIEKGDGNYTIDPRVLGDLKSAGFSLIEINNLSPVNRLKFSSAMMFCNDLNIQKVYLAKSDENTNIEELISDLNQFLGELGVLGKKLFEQYQQQRVFKQARDELLETIKSDSSDTDVKRMQALAQNILQKINACKGTGKISLTVLTNALIATRTDVNACVDLDFVSNANTNLRSCQARIAVLDDLLKMNSDKVSCQELGLEKKDVVASTELCKRRLLEIKTNGCQSEQAGNTTDVAPETKADAENHLRKLH